MMNLSGLPVDLEEFIQQELAQGTYRSEAELVADAVRLLREHHQRRERRPHNGAPAMPIWEAFEDSLNEIPEEELDRLPPDAAKEHDHYIYGTPKKSA
jgi:Arc/MetJ-type ribon-helix-helix transcriptional regulator